MMFILEAFSKEKTIDSSNITYITLNHFKMLDSYRTTTRFLLSPHTVCVSKTVTGVLSPS